MTLYQLSSRASHKPSIWEFLSRQHQPADAVLLLEPVDSEHLEGLKLALPAYDWYQLAPTNLDSSLSAANPATADPELITVTQWFELIERADRAVTL